VTAGRDDLAALLDRYFDTAELSGLERDRLIAAAHAALADAAVRAGLATGLRSAGTVAGGLAWWEELRAAGGATGDRASVLLLWTSDPSLDPRPRPRPHCPAAYVGTWRAADGRSWRLDGDGGLGGDGERAGWTWRIRGGPLPHLCLGPPGQPLREQWLVEREGADALDLIPPGATRGHQTWRRVR
jgi:hypothetical protein